MWKANGFSHTTRSVTAKFTPAESLWSTSESTSAPSRTGSTARIGRARASRFGFIKRNILQLQFGLKGRGLLDFSLIQGDYEIHTIKPP